MPKFLPKGQLPEPPAPPELTGPRLELATLLERRASLTEEKATLAGRVEKLKSAQSEVAAAQNELDALGAREQAEMLQWASADDGSEAPAPDTAERQRVTIALARAKAKQVAADGATQSVLSQAQSVDAAIAALTHPITAARAFILLEEAMTRVPALRAAIREAKRLSADIESGRMAALSAARSLPDDDQRPFFQALEASTKAHLQNDIKEHDDEPERAAWRRFAAALDHDAAIKFEDAPEAIALAVYSSPAIDPVLAAAAQAAAFPSQSITR